MTPTPQLSRADERKANRARVKKGRYEQYVRESLAAKGHSFLRVNWKKRTIHYLDEKGNKRTCAFYGI